MLRCMHQYYANKYVFGCCLNVSLPMDSSLVQSRRRIHEVGALEDVLSGSVPVWTWRNLAHMLPGGDAGDTNKPWQRTNPLSMVL